MILVFILTTLIRIWQSINLINQYPFHNWIKIIHIQRNRLQIDKICSRNKHNYQPNNINIPVTFKQFDTLERIILYLIHTLLMVRFDLDRSISCLVINNFATGVAVFAKRMFGTLLNVLVLILLVCHGDHFGLGGFVGVGAQFLFEQELVFQYVFFDAGGIATRTLQCTFSATLMRFLNFGFNHLFELMINATKITFDISLCKSV